MLVVFMLSNNTVENDMTYVPKHVSD